MRNFMGLSVMHMAAQGDKPNMLIYFKDEFGFSINDRDFPGNTPLHWACHMAAENSINFLLSWMSDINILDRKGQTPLHLGIYHLKPKIIKKLIRKGADINLKDFSGRSVLDILNDQKMRVANFEKVLKVIQCANIQRYFQTITCNQKQFHVWDSFQRKKFNQHGYPCGYNQREQLDVVHHAMHHDTFRLHFSALESVFCRF